MEKRIWVLGSEHPNAHKSIPWRSPFPNFANCDVLVINLQSLGSEQFKARYSELHEEAQRYIFDLLMTGEKEVIVILPSGELDLAWLPLYPLLKGTAPAEVGESSIQRPADEYMKTVETCSFYIHNFRMSYFIRKTNPKSTDHENYPFTKKAEDFGYKPLIRLRSRILNKAKQTIGCCLYFVIEIMYGGEYESVFESGNVLFLPPPTKIMAEQAIDIMVNILTGSELVESPPRWENEINLPELLGVEDKIAQKNQEEATLIKEIEKLEDRRNELIRFRRLLWTKGAHLENAVKEAFVFLGFSEIGKIRDANLEDWVVSFESTSQYEYGILEVKGSDARTALADLTQCNKWVDDYFVEKRGKAKGVFVPNQYRLGDIGNNREQREHFEDNELEYAESRTICILPSHEIFSAVVEKMKGNTRISRKFIEEKIITTNGICNLVET